MFKIIESVIKLVAKIDVENPVDNFKHRLVSLKEEIEVASDEAERRAIALTELTRRRPCSGSPRTARSTMYGKLL